jgi:HSP20 family protein
MANMQNLLRQFVGAPMEAELAAPTFGIFPTVEIAETPEEFTLTAELPGTTPADITVEFEGGVLTLHGKKEKERHEGDGDRSYHLYERTFGTFQRSFTFPGSVDEKKIAAEFKNGVLTVHLPKLQDARARGRRIEIDARR